MIRLLAAAVALMLTPGLAPETHYASPASFQPESVTVVVRNRRVDELTIWYRFEGSGTRRLGTVQPGKERTYVFPVLGSRLSMVMRVPRESAVVTEPEEVQGGDRFELLVHGSLNPRALRRIGSAQ